MVGHTHSGWNNPRVLLVLSLVFVCGALSGVAFSRLLLPAAAAGRPVLNWQEGGKEVSLQKFKSELSLTPQQYEEIESVLDDFVMYYQMLQTQMDEARASGKERILQSLTPAQRQKFERMLTEVQARRLR
jgi:Spy/CpxP family protein refolding chaperone